MQIFKNNFNRFFYFEVCEHLETELLIRKFASGEENFPFKLSALSNWTFVSADNQTMAKREMCRTWN